MTEPTVLSGKEISTVWLGLSGAWTCRGAAGARPKLGREKANRDGGESQHWAPGRGKHVARDALAHRFICAHSPGCGHSGHSPVIWLQMAPAGETRLAALFAPAGPRLGAPTVSWPSTEGSVPSGGFFWKSPISAAKPHFPLGNRH